MNKPAKRKNLEATKTIIKGKSLHFPGIPVIIRQVRPYNFLTAILLSLSMVAIMPLLSITAYTSISACNATNQDSCVFIKLLLPVGSYAMVYSGFISQQFFLENSTSANNKGSDAILAFCVKQKTNKNIDCTITSAGSLKQQKYSGKQIDSCTLKGVVALPVYPSAT